MPLLTDIPLRNQDATDEIPQLTQQARDLIHETVRELDEYYGTGTMSCAIYDTAWVALIARTEDNGKRWLFPESFQYLIDNQTENGDWDTEKCASENDSILNTASALLALKRHQIEPLQIDHIEPSELRERVEKATVALKHKLKNWDVSSSTHVGFEIIVPALLRLLESTLSTQTGATCDEGIFQFQFSGREELMKLNTNKLARFRPEFLYAKGQSTALHSLEAFIGQIDFDRLAHHKVLGSMMASPSSTAAYLISASNWDQEAEEYIRHVVYRGPGKGTGAVPSAYPSTNFEFSWILSTLLAAGFTSADLDCPGTTLMTWTLRQSMLTGAGIIGFAPDLQPDADDTAKSIFVLGQLLDQPEEVSVNGMIRAFEAESYFRTYPAERDPSFSANCNVLIALLHAGDPMQSIKQLVKVTKFLCECWWSSYGNIKDKWNLCHLYPTMLMVEAFSRLLDLVDEDAALIDAFGDQTIARVSISLFQGCFRTLMQQGLDGSWNASREASSYAGLILHYARRICFLQPLRPRVDYAINLVRKYLQSDDDSVPAFLWIEKVTYMSPMLSKAYYLAALRACNATVRCTHIGLIGRTLGIQYDAPIMKNYTQVIQQTPLFAQMPEWQICGSGIEASLFEPLLRQRRHEIFTRDNMKEDKYFSMLPLTWTACNNRAGTPASCTFMFDMMFLSVLGFQVDEFMESVAGPAFQPDFKELKCLIDELFSDYNRGSTAINSQTAALRISNGQLLSATVYDKVRWPLKRYIQYILHHEAVQQANDRDVYTLRQELKQFLYAHITQAADNHRLAKSDASQSFDDPESGFYRWVHTTSADHTGCPYAFAFAGCLISFTSCISPSSLSPTSATPPYNSTKRPAIWQTAEQKYLAADLCRHLSTMCRMYNDYGSIQRDRDEGNLNSVDFSEFGKADLNAACEESVAKAALFRLAEYERKGVESAFAHLVDASENIASKAATHGRKTDQMGVWRLFVDVTDLYGQIYVVKDIASRMK